MRHRRQARLTMSEKGATSGGAAKTAKLAFVEGVSHVGGQGALALPNLSASLSANLSASPPAQESEDLDVIEHEPPVPLHFGMVLRRAREARGMTIADVAQKTRISSRWVQALEDAELDGLPAPVFVSGYLRSCARLLGLDGEALLTRYHDLVQSHSGSASPVERGAHRHHSHHHPHKDRSRKKHKSGVASLLSIFDRAPLLLWLCLLAVVFAAVVFFVWRRGLLHV